MEHGYDVPLLVNMQPAGQYLSERFHRAGGVPAVMWELLQAGKLDGSALTCTGRTQAENLAGREATDREVILPYAAPLKERAGFLVLVGQSVRLRDHEDQRHRATNSAQRYLSRPGDEGVFEARAIVFDGSDDYHHRINDPVAGHRRELHPRDPRLGRARLAGICRGREHAAARRALQRGITSLPTLGDGRQSGTSDSPRSSTLRPKAPLAAGSRGCGPAT